MDIRYLLKNVYEDLVIRNTSSSYIKYLKKTGVQIGNNCTIYYPKKATIDTSAPHLLTIGNHVKITGPATILTHDYSWSVLKGKTGEILGNQKPVKIGDNVFIGWGAVVLCGTTIEDNVIIAANAVVSGHIEHDSVWDGVPARKICTLDQYRDKRAAKQLSEAKQFVQLFHLRHGRDPKPEEVPEYFFLFADQNHLNERYRAQLGLMGTLEKSLDLISSPNVRQFSDFDAFLEYCRE